MDVMFKNTAPAKRECLRYCEKCNEFRSPEGFIADDIDWNMCKSCYENSVLSDYFVDKETAVRYLKRVWAIKQTDNGTVDREAIIKRDKSICHICKKKVKPSEIHLDHIVPLAKGGEHRIENVAVSHRRCNQIKHAAFIPVQLAMFGNKHRLIRVK